MRLHNIGGSRLIPEPSMPAGLVELMEDLTRSVLRNNPADLYEYCTNHMAKLIEIRDGRGPRPQLTVEQKIARAQKKMRKKAEERRRKYDMEMELLRNSSKDPEEEQTEVISETEALQKIPVREEEKIAQSSELEIAHQINDDSVLFAEEIETRKTVISGENLTEGSQMNSKDLKDDSFGVTDEEKAISKIDAKYDETVPTYGIDTIDSAEILPDMTEDKPDALNIAVKDSIENKVANVNSTTETLENANEVEESFKVIGNADNDQADSITEKQVSETHIKKETDVVKEDKKNANVTTNHNQDEANEENSETNENITDLKSVCINESNQIAHSILNDVVHKSEAYVNEAVESKASIDVEEKQINENEIERNLEDDKDPELVCNKIVTSSIDKSYSDKGSEQDKNEISKDVDKKNYEQEDPSVKETLPNLENTVNSAIINKDEINENVIDEPNQVAVDDLPKQESHTKNIAKEIPAEKKTAYLCGDENEKSNEILVDNEICSDADVADKLNDTGSNEMMQVKLANELDKDDKVEENITTETELHESSSETVDKQLTNTTKTLNITDKESIGAISNNQTIKAETFIGNIGNAETIHNNETLVVIESLENTESESKVSNQTSNDSKNINDIETLKQTDESNKVINDNHAVISEDKKLVAESVDTEICNETQPTRKITSNQDDSEKTESKVDVQKEDNLTDKPDKLEVSNDQLQTKLKESMSSSEANISKPESDENKTNPGEEKENEDIVDPITDCETIELTVKEHGHKDNDASIEMPQDDTSAEGTPEHEINKRTEDEISDIQEISGLSDLQQLHTIETNSIGKRSSVGDSTIDENSDSNGESDTIKESNDNSQSPSTMDLETAAVTIQKVFRSFMFKSRCSTFDDAGNDDNNSMDDDREDMNYEVISSKERRPLGISRMDTVTVLQTVNEEKSLSLSTDDSSLSSAATIIQAHVRGFLVRNRLNSSKTSSNSLVNSDGQAGQSFETDGEPQTNKTILNIQLVPEGGHYLSRDESVLTSIDLSLDGSPPSSINLHPLGYDKSEPRKQLHREDAIQSISPPSNNSGKLSEDSIKGGLSNDSEHQTSTDAERGDEVVETEEKLDDNSCETTPSKSTTVETVIEVKKLDNNSVEASEENEKIKDNRSTEASSDEGDVVSPFKTNGKYSRSDSDDTCGLLHSGEFHDIVLPTKVSRKTSVVRGE